MAIGSTSARHRPISITRDLRTTDRHVTVDGLDIRYIEHGAGDVVILLHGGSLGSSADVYRRNLWPLANGGFRVIAVDHPGYGLSDNPSDYSAAARSVFVLQFMDALGIARASLIGHSIAGGLALGLAFGHPERVFAVVVLGSGPLLPPLPADGTEPNLRRVGMETGASSEPTLEETRGSLEAMLYHRDLITPEELALYHSHSTGRGFTAAVLRQKNSNGQVTDSDLWKRLSETPVPLLMIYGAQDRANAGARAQFLKKLQPNLDLHIVEHCKHLIQWDAAPDFHRLAIPFITRAQTERPA